MADSYDLEPRLDPAVTMSPGKPLAVGPTARLQTGTHLGEAGADDGLHATTVRGAIGDGFRQRERPSTAAFDRSIVRHTEHRPWPMPATPWLMTQSWHNLLFAHWRVEVATLRRLVPAAFELDLFNGEAWLGIVPFSMSNVGLRGTPSLPWLSSFPELNVRTYVRVGDRPGVYFFSLDAGRRLAVAAARTFLNLPYFSASMNVDTAGDAVVYQCAREGTRMAVFEAEYGPTDPPFRASEGSLEHFLTERYCLYHQTRRAQPYRLEIHHPPWSLQLARADIKTNTMAAASGVPIDEQPALLHFARRQDVIAWAPTYLRLLQTAATSRSGTRTSTRVP